MSRSKSSYFCSTWQNITDIVQYYYFEFNNNAKLKKDVQYKQYNIFSNL